jgi:hypothetical protein
VSFQVRAPRGRAVRWSVAFGEQRFEFETEARDWKWTDPVEVDLGPGAASGRLRSRGPGPLDVERVRIERLCPGPCPGEKVKACLDKGFDRHTGLSEAVIRIEGHAGHATHEADSCGAKGYYFVSKGNTAKPGRIVAELDVPTAGRYLFRFQYRVGSPGRTRESIRVAVGGRVFDFPDARLRNTNTFEWSPPLEVGLEAGRQAIELLSIGRDSVHVEKVDLERVCECGSR